ncbi:hypothetical protein [Lactobacillus sp. HT06-2]|uniref:hypothetical protein n=1 Tax=Lactobacillus sp. HT06-2 TaxID=2080222 RepID=UPI000CD9467E|nr:hypothetical protein [Lactobacillus sp. HT06-2]
MSQIREPAYITNAGKTMMTAGGDVTYTKAVLYGQDISHLRDDQIQALTAIGNPLREVKVGIADKQSNDKSTTVILEATFQNSNLAEDLPFTAVGFFAKRGEDQEQLIAVGVANAGAFLAATGPDGVATDAIDLKLAIAIGDATNVMATIDPAGSVTPTTLNGAISDAKQELSEQIDTKADKATVDDAIAKIDFTPYAKTVDVDTALATKADKDAVDAELATKADTTALADYDKTTDVDSKIKTVTDLANSKVDATYSYSKADLDKKLLALSTDTSGKVDANVLTQMLDSKADKAALDSAKTDLNNAINTKANALDVYTKAQTDAQISKFDLSKLKFRKQMLNGNGYLQDKTWSATRNSDGTYTIDLYDDDWTASKLYSVIEQVKDVNGTVATKANSSDVYTKDQTDSKISAIDFGKIKFRKQFLDYKGEKIDKTWNATKNDDGTYTINLFDDDWTASKLHDVIEQVNGLSSSKADKTQVQDAKNTVANAINQLAGRKTLKSPDFNDIKDTGSYYITFPDGGKNEPAGGTWGNLLVSNGDGHRISQMYFPDDSRNFCFRVCNEGTWKVWKQIADEGDVTTLQDTVKQLQSMVNQQAQTITSLQNMVTNQSQEIAYIKANYIEGKRFSKSQEQDAQNWENQNPQRVAFVEDN